MNPAEYAEALDLGLITVHVVSLRGKTGDLYVFKSGPYVKVGVSAVGWRSRVESIRCHNPFVVRKVAVRTVPLCSLRYAEKYVHDELRPYHHSREWFCVDKKIAIAAVTRAVVVARLVEKRLEAAYLAREQNRVFGTILTQPRKVTPKPAWSKWGKRKLYPRVTQDAL